METYRGIGTPPLSSGQYYVTQAEVWTGIILTLDGKRRDTRSGEPYILVFDTLAEAEGYAEAKVLNAPEVECHILDHDGNMLKRVVNTSPARNIQKRETAPWKFWRT